MGLLDEAIREHLELKRRHGADPGEIARLEHEALGPARREPVEAAAAATEAPPALDESNAPPATGPEPLAEPPAPQGDPLGHEALEQRLPEREEAVGPPTEEAPAPEQGPGASTREPDDPETVPPDEEPEDVLEETPEFLQETPEHDRLWFEQKPPRDFDF